MKGYYLDYNGKMQETEKGIWFRCKDVENLRQENVRIKKLNQEMVEALKEIKEIAYSVATSKGNLNIGYIIDFYEKVGNKIIAKAEEGS